MTIRWNMLFNLHSNNELALTLCGSLDLREGQFDMRHFPDGESYVRVLDEVKDLNVVVLADLYQPDHRTLPLLLLAETLRDLGAKEILLVAPYLPYMRQDKRFHGGEGVTSRYFAQLLSRYFSALVTVDPHLHRYHNLSEIYGIPTQVAHAAPVIAEWIATIVDNPVLIGPDSESEQWVTAVAKQAGVPFTVLSKTRRGDREVEISVPHLEQWLNHTPVLVDDIISSGHTMLETMAHLNRLGLPKVVCIGVHGIFAEGADMELIEKSARLVSCNTISHPSNAINIGGLLATSIRELA
ncbi:ribose-phosphate pyrophosphokinase [Marinimicrobium sp. C6131]|uniref:ribose-phosphate pyrophosphokinase n=1 Tax=Marinimicrobium sp. C6131 TaxID=3022676 RepID=UPI002AC7FD56|nr:ribose-phosphate pyrophosphokinase [Marinimicrobium sp. C6131]